MAVVFVPANWRVFTSNEKLFTIDAPTVRAAMECLIEQFPVLRPRIFNSAGEFASYINLYVDDTDIRSLQRGDTPLAPGSEVRVIPALAGG